MLKVGKEVKAKGSERRDTEFQYPKYRRWFIIQFLHKSEHDDKCDFSH